MNVSKLYARATLALAALSLIVAAPCFGQEARATVSGTITDPSGSAMVGARVHITNLDTGVAQSAQSNEVGQYHLLFVNPGAYRLTVEMPGFHTLVREGIQLTLGQAATLDVSLQVGTQSETVTVAATAPLLEAEKADRGLVVNQRDMSGLPILARVPIMLATLTPGVIWSAPNYNSLAPFSNGAFSSWSINGSISPSAEFLLDGAPNDMIYQAAHSIAYVPPVDAVEEFKVVTGAYDAQYGRNGGGVVAIAMKSGTNKLHGSAYEFMKRSFLDANTFANNAIGGARNYDKLDQWGFTAGGPVWIPKVYNGKDRTFFFVAYERYRDNTLARNQLSSVPTMAQRSGNFSQTFNNAGQLNPIYDPATGRSVNGTWVRDVFPGNIVPAGRIDPVGSKIASIYPLPNITPPGLVNWQNNYFSPLFTQYFFPNVVARLDHNFGDKERVYGRFVYNNQFLEDISNNYLTGPGGDLRFGNKVNTALVLDSVTIFNPSTTLDLRASINRWTQNYVPPAYGAANGAEAIGLPASLVSQFETPGRFPYITASNYQYLGESSSNIWYAPSTNLALSPTLSLIRGRHSIRTGLDFRLMHLANYQPAFAGGTFAFDQTFTRANYLTADSLSGNAVASMLLGAATSGGVDYIARPYFSWRYYAPWVQDDIKVTRRLTVNLGLRWDILGPLTERYNRLNYGFFPTQLNPISSQINQTQFPGYKAYGGIGFTGVGGLPRTAFNTDWNNVQPRVGAAFQLTPTTVLRGGFGISYIPQVSFGNSYGFSQSTPYVASLDANQTPAGTVSNPFPSGLLQPAGSSQGLATLLGQSPNFADASGRIGYTYSYSFGIQKQFGNQIRVEASYVGSRTKDAPVSNGYNALSRQNLALGDITQGGNPNALNQKVANPFQNLLPGTSLNSSTVTQQQLLLPFPQFTGFSQQNIPSGQVWYNSLQTSVQKRYANGLSVTGSYTFSKNLQALSYLNPQDATPARTIVPFDRTHVLVIAPIYELPFGPGRAFLTSSSGIISRLVGGWRVMGNFTYQSGVPMTVPGGVFVIGNPVLSNSSPDQMFNTGLIDSTGKLVNQVGNLPPAFQIQPAFALRTASLYFGNLRDRWGPDFNLAMVKSTHIKERVSLEFRADALNVMNHPLFGGDPILATTSPNFGKLLLNNGQTNEPRQVQLSLRLVF
jgi:Carboxypeptidase regulatory-like domain/TonB-dependent Receptor Plug Domain